MTDDEKEDSPKEEKPSEGFLKFQKAIKEHSSDVFSLLNCHLLVEYYLEQIIQLTD